MHMSSQSFDPNRPVFWKFNIAQLVTVILVIVGGAFSAGGTWAIVNYSIDKQKDSLSDLKTLLTSIDEKGPRATADLPKRVTGLETWVTSIDKDGPAYAQRRNFDGRISGLEAAVKTMDATGTQASQRGIYQESEISKANAMRIAAAERALIDQQKAILDLVAISKETQVNVQWIVKQQGGK